MTFTNSRPPYTDLDPNEIGSLKSRGYTQAELKYDGNWGEFIGGPQGWKIYSRRGKIKATGREKVPVCHLQGEYLIGTQWAQRPDRKKQFKVFGVKCWKKANHDVTNLEEQKKLRGVVCLDLNKAGFSWFAPVVVYRVHDAEKLWKQFVEQSDYEGLVFRGPKGKMARMKKNVSMDYVILAITPSTSTTYKGWGAKSISGGLYEKGKLVKKVNISGMTNDQRRELWTNREKLVGKVFEATGKLLFTSGALRHPSFERIRDDKKPRECVWPLA